MVKKIKINGIDRPPGRAGLFIHRAAGRTGPGRGFVGPGRARPGWVFKSPKWWGAADAASAECHMIRSSTDFVRPVVDDLISSTTRKFLTQYTDSFLKSRLKSSLFLAFLTNSTFELELRSYDL